MKILYITDSLMLGGIETQLVDLVTHLDRSRYEPAILCFYGPDARDVYFAEQLREHNIPLFLLNRQWGIPDKFRIIAAIQRITQSFHPDIIQTENYHANLLSRIAQFTNPHPILIGTQRGVYTPKQLLYERLSTRICTTHVVSADHLAQQLTDKAGIKPHRIHVIHNAIDVPRFAQSKENTIRHDVAPNARRLLLSLGRISTQKRMHLIAEGMGMLKEQGRLPSDAHILIVGPIQDQAMYDLLIDAMNRYNLQSWITILPGTTTPEQYYAACDATILYSVDESYPCVMMESLAAGRPVLISDVANAANVITAGETGWIAPVDDLAAFAEQLWQAMTLSAHELARMQQASSKRGQLFSLDHLITAYQALYDELVHR